MTITSPIRQINKATPRQTAELRADLYSELPMIIVERKITVKNYNVEFMQLVNTN